MTHDELMIDVRERLVRIETKMDGHAEKDAERVKTLDDHDDRISALEDGARSVRAYMALLSWAGGAALAVATLFSGAIDRLFT